MEPKLKPPRTKRLKLKCDTLLSTSAFKSNLRRYTKRLGEAKATIKKKIGGGDDSGSGGSTPTGLSGPGKGVIDNQHPTDVE
jgi:hypothetical protein